MEVLGVGVHGDELDPAHLRVNHMVHGILAGTADPDDPDAGKGLYLWFNALGHSLVRAIIALGLIMQILTNRLYESLLREKLGEKLPKGGAHTLFRDGSVSGQPPDSESIGDCPGRIANLSVWPDAKLGQACRKLQRSFRDVANSSNTGTTTADDDARREWATAAKRLQVFVHQGKQRGEPRRDEVINLLARVHGTGELAELHPLGFFERDTKAERDVVGDVACARWEDFDRHRDALVVDDDRDGPGPNICQGKALPFF